MKTTLNKLVAVEGRMWRSLFRWVFVKRSGGFTYIQPINPVLWAFIIVSAVETVALHLILPWPVVRIVVDVLSVYGLVWMFGMLAGYKVHLHRVDDDGIRIRNGFFVDLLIPWEDIAAVRPNRKLQAGSGMVQVEGQVLAVVVGGQTNVEVELRGPTLLREATVDKVRFYVDDPDGFTRLACR